MNANSHSNPAVPVVEGVPGLRGASRALSVLEDALVGSPADQTELVLLADSTDVTRYANSEIHQSVAQVDTRISVRVALGRTTARVFTNSLDIESIRRTIEDAVSLARMQSANPRFQPLPAPDIGYPMPGHSPQSFYPSTAGLSARARADAIGNVIDAASSVGCRAFGTYRSSASELAVASSTGIRSYAAYSTAYLKALVEGPQGTGFGDAYSRDALEIDAERVGREAIKKCLANREQAEIEPGEYEAVFEPNAVADMLRFPVIWGMGARSVLDGQSFMSGKLGEQVTGPVVSVWDDPTDARCLPLSIDYEGLPAQRVDIITEGVARGPVYDTATAQEAGTRSTGHAGIPFGDFPGGPAPDHIVMPVGTGRAEEMVRNVRHGVWVTRFHYTHCPDPKRVIATGTTRDGTFLIKDGEVVGALRNLRLEMGVLELLASLQESGEGKLCQDWWAQNGMDSTNYFVPSMRFGSCRFTGVTTF
ncbi:MAG TPA: TldD/PmbA family protein [Chloroflexia bacterium]|nr:TldD/PmbA family protein [Chloroflexia bacterium]